MLESLNDTFQLFGATVIVPIMIFLISMCLRVPVKKAVEGSIYAGVGLTGFGWIISAFTPIITPIVKQMVETTGIDRSVVDIGWQTGSLTAFSTSIGLSFFIFGLVIELILFLVGVTRVFVPSNLWNNFGYMIWGAVAYQVTHNFWLSFGLMIFLLLYTLLLSEVIADRWSEYYGIKNATINSIHNIESAIPALLFDPLWNKLGLNNVSFNLIFLKEKLGLFGRPTTLGAILGLLIGILGNLTRLLILEAWGQILTFTVSLAAVMTIFPLVTEVFSKAFVPIEQAVEKNREQKNSSAKKRWFLAVDDGVGYGEPATILSGILLIPILVVLALILPGNKTLPVVDLISIPFMIESMVALSKGNMVKILLNSVIWLGLGLYASSYMTPFYTETVMAYGSALPAGVVLITSFNLFARPLTTVLFALWITGNPWIIGTMIGVYLVLLYFLRTRREAIYAYLKRNAEKNRMA